ncbi:thioredoxin family protein [Flavobacterium caeni]|uniref:Thioredoxin-like n=1 Tax=Flavobacterium caeni TaxID=490189 RepID=A0A1G5D3B0_9FLAO|nr:thioredoxin family protein [Flavobacterium caeni]SCY08950.1 Thioredoxin-like [Flavobacterium caeni]
MKTTAIVVLMLFAGSAFGQWQSDLKAAIKEASATDKKVLLYFTGGEDCENCIQLQQQVLETTEFLAYAREHFVLVRQDFLSKENLEENLLIVEKYNKDGFFPLVVIIGGNAKRIGQIGVYQNETPGQYIDKLRALAH